MPQGYVGRPFRRPFGVPSPYSEPLYGSRGDVVRHWIARAAFMREVCAHPRVVEAFARWGGEAGLLAAAAELADARDNHARNLGFAGRAEMLLPDFADVELRERIENPAKIERLRALLDGAEETFASAQAGTWIDATLLVRELLPEAWPWVAVELIGAFHRGVLSHVLGVQVVLHVRIAKHAARTWRLDRMYAVGQALLEVDPATDGSRLPAEKPDTIERDAQWLYRHRVLGHKVDDIAQGYCDGERAQRHYPHHGMRSHSWRDDRKTVFDGIKKTDTLLAMTTARTPSGD